MDPATLIFASIGASIFGGITGAVGALQEGKAAKQSAEFQAGILDQQATREREIAKLEATRIRRSNERLAGTQRAVLASRGDASTGSALLLQEDLAEESAFEQALAIAGGETQASRLQQQAEIRRLEGRQAVRSSRFRAGATLLKGFGSAAGTAARAPKGTFG